MNIDITKTSQNSIGALELTDADLSTVTGACGSHSQGQEHNTGYQFDNYQSWGHQHHRHHGHRHHHFGGGHHSGGGNQFGDDNQLSFVWFGGQGSCND
ncbi:hypothetical protein KDA_57450 [Dictyobacter alpinus]|uniref:Uncharacterized protein n=1 Tax=Dictyobacter alpinus TaxID=2014873 RepID=A0A402BFR7_9CHLR|nr:hypothetical protein [Dictyobacter alpinus]GCE30261.1 hypothetical protein KDA_57450 [Dictyobacter alpinus]